MKWNQGTIRRLEQAVLEDEGVSFVTASDAETITGTSTTKAVTPAGLKYERPYIDVRSYGAVGDGVADDTAAIQDAIDMGISQQMHLQWTPGQYKITTGLVISGPVEIHGSWSGTAGTGTSVLCTGTTNAISVTTSERVLIHGVRLVGSAGAANGFVTEYSGGTPFMHHFIRCRASSFTAAGFWQRNGEFTLWDNCFAYGCGTGFLADQSSNTIAGSGVNNEWRQCRAQACTGDGFDIQDQIGFRLIGCEGLDNVAPNGQIRIRGNTFGGTIDGADTEITTGGTSTTGISLSGSRHIVRGHQANHVTSPIAVLAGTYCEFHTLRYVSCTNGVVYSSTADAYNLVFDPIAAVFDPIPETSHNTRVPTAILREEAVTTLGNDIQGAAPGASTVWPAANDVAACRCVANRVLAITKLSWVVGGTSAGNYDIGILDSAGAVLWKKGSTTFPAISTAVTDTVSPTVTIQADTVFWVVLASDSATATFRGIQYTASVECMLSDGTPKFARVASTFPLPAVASTLTLTTVANRAPKILVRTD
jgi:hypothetical protein